MLVKHQWWCNIAKDCPAVQITVVSSWCRTWAAGSSCTWKYSIWKSLRSSLENFQKTFYAVLTPFFQWFRGFSKLKAFLKFSTELLQCSVIKRSLCSQEFLDLQEISVNSSLFLFSVWNCSSTVGLPGTLVLVQTKIPMMRGREGAISVFQAFDSSLIIQRNGWWWVSLSVSTIKPIPFCELLSSLARKEEGKKKSETGKEFGWYIRKNSQAKVIKLIYYSFQTLMFHWVIFHLLSGTVTAPEI